MTPTPCATCGYPINPGAPHYANDRGSHHGACGDPFGSKAAADRIAELEAALRELLDIFNPEPRMDDIGLIWGRAARALKGKS